MSPQECMRECLRLALLGRGAASPNPLVGAVLVKDGTIIARGYHRRFGGAHAEVDCLRHAPGDLRNATLYVNLEPCSHHGKTPPCVDEILRRGIGSVVTAMEDPNPLVAGRGLSKLRQAGVKTSVGLLKAEAQAINRAFITHITAHRPYVHVKIAESWDGRITGGRSRWISSPLSRKRVHEMRAEYDAILVGAGTVRVDDPSLTVRLARGRDPDVVIVDGAFALPLHRKVFAANQSRRVFVATTKAAVRRKAGKAEVLARRGVELLVLSGAGERLSLLEVLRLLYERNVGSILVEGGASIFAQFLSGGLVDEVTLFVAPEIFGRGLGAFGSATMSTRNGKPPAKVTVRSSGRDAMLNIQFE